MASASADRLEPMWLLTPTAPGTAESAARVASVSSPADIPEVKAPGPGLAPDCGSIGR